MFTFQADYFSHKTSRPIINMAHVDSKINMEALTEHSYTQSYSQAVPVITGHMIEIRGEQIITS